MGCRRFQRPAERCLAAAPWRRPATRLWLTAPTSKPRQILFANDERGNLADGVWERCQFGRQLVWRHAEAKNVAEVAQFASS